MLSQKKLYALGIIDKILSSNDMFSLSKKMAAQIEVLKDMDAGLLIEERYKKFRSIGYM